MRKLFLFFLFLVLSIAQASANNINKIVFFGDSLSDNGNLYALLCHFLPKSPPYFQGHFSDGTTWAENIANHYHDTNAIDYKIYAVGGATAIFHMPTTNFIAPMLLDLEVDAYLIDSLFKDRSGVLFVIWIGSNDYLFYPDMDADVGTDQIVHSIASAIKTLKENGGKHFLVLNLPDLSRTPEIRNDGGASMVKLHTLSVLHNQKLDAAVQAIRHSDPAITITSIDIFAMFNDIMDNPEFYNKKYQVNITNTTDACWTGGYFLKRELSAAAVTKDIQRAFAMRGKQVARAFDAQAMSEYILTTPELSFAYQMDKAYELGKVPCVNPNEHLFWDAIHPTGVAHEVLAKVVVEKLGALS